MIIYSHIIMITLIIHAAGPLDGEYKLPESNYAFVIGATAWINDNVFLYEKAEVYNKHCEELPALTWNIPSYRFREYKVHKDTKYVIKSECDVGSDSLDLFRGFVWAMDNIRSLNDAIFLIDGDEVTLDVVGELIKHDLPVIPHVVVPVVAPR